MPDNEPVIIQKHKNSLRSKVTLGGPGAVDEEALGRAEQAVADMGERYIKWAQGDLDTLQAAFDELEAAGGDDKEAAAKVFHAAHDIKGQGGSFGYDLMTAVANELCRLLETLDHIGPGELNAIEVHIDSMKLIIQERIVGDGGENGRRILGGVQQVRAKLSERGRKKPGN